MAQEEKIFADGFVFKRSENAPDFVVGRISIKADDAIAFIQQHVKNGWVNLGVKQARSGNYYMELDTFEAESKAKTTTKPTKKVAEEEDSPF
jgi:hypothetical protein